MAKVITIDNFNSKVPPFDPAGGTKKALFALVDMGR
jgi:hypothetical protein